jgi:magnesium-transporting ATPase (P-type)
MKKIVAIKNKILGIVFILIDLVVYLFLGVAMIDYDDKCEEVRKKYNSLETMNTFQKSIFVTMNIWNIINIILLIFIIYKVYLYFRLNKQLYA